MRKRYAYWRMPTGEPERGNQHKYAPRNILAHLGRSVIFGPDKKISWTNLPFSEYDLALKSSVIIIDNDDNEMNQEDAWSLINNSILKIIREQGKNQPVDPDKLLSAINEAAATHFRKPSTQYNLVSSLSVAGLPSKVMRIGKSKISAFKPKRDNYELPSLLKYPVNPQIANHVKNSRYLRIRVRTEGRTVREAAENGQRDLNLLRGYWNLLATYGRRTVLLGASTGAPLGAVYIGPIYILYDTDGRLVSDMYWYEPAYTEDQRLFDPKNKWDQIESDRRWLMAKARKVPYKKTLDRLLIRYALALDNTNFDNAFLHMWALLENITDTVGSRYEETIKRALWSFDNREINGEILNALRLRRNQLVHSAKSGEDTHLVAQTIKAFVDPHLLHLIRNDFKVPNLSEYGRHLSLSPNISSLIEQRTRISHAIRVQKKYGESKEG